MLISKKDKIFIAGHTGMVGSSIKRSLIKKGYTNLLCPNREELDLLNFSKVENWFKKNKPDIVILAAAKVGGINANSTYSADFILENLKIQNNVIENAWREKIKRFIFLGSSCIYPKFAEQPIKEEFLLNGPLESTNESYALAKIAGIKLCAALKTQYGFDSICLMPTNLYGPGDNYNVQNSHVLPALIRKIYDAKLRSLDKIYCWGTGSPLREFLFVDDLAEATIFVLETISSDNQYLYDCENNFKGILNVGVGLDISIKELSELISSIIGYEGEIFWDKTKPDGTPKKLLNISKLTNLGWIPKTTLKEGIKITLEKYIEDLNKNLLRI